MSFVVSRRGDFLDFLFVGIAFFDFGETGLHLLAFFLFLVSLGTQLVELTLHFKQLLLHSVDLASEHFGLILPFVGGRNGQHAGKDQECRQFQPGWFAHVALPRVGN